MAGNQVRRIEITASVAGNSEIRKLASDMGLLNKSAKSTAGDLRFLSSAFSTLFGAQVFGFGVRELANVADGMFLLSSRINVLAGSTEEGARAFEGLLKVANRTKSDVQDLAVVYARLASSTRRLGVDTEGVLLLTETLQSAFLIGGATAMEAAGAAVQMGQAFSSGTLRGQELRSVLEASAPLADILRKKFGNDLFKQAEKGMLTTIDVMIALIEESGNLSKEAEQLGKNFGQTLTVAFNDFKKVLLDIVVENKLMEKFESLVNSLKESWRLLAGVLVSLAIPAILKLTAAFAGLLSVSGKLGLAVRALTSLALAAGLVSDLMSKAEDPVEKDIKRYKELTESLEKYKKQLSGVDFAAPFNYAQQVKNERLLKKIKSTQEEINLLQNNRVGAFLPERPTDAQLRESVRLDQLRKLNEMKSREATRLASELDKKNVFNREFQLRKLNNDLKNSRITTEQYYDSLLKLDQKIANNNFETGKTDLEKFNSEMSSMSVKKLTLEFNQGINPSLEQFNNLIKENKLKTLNDDMKSGAISSREYKVELAKVNDELFSFESFRAIGAGATDYIKSIGTVGEQIASATKNAFSGLEDGFTEFIRTGTQDWKKFADDVLNEITRIMVRAAIIRPLAGGIESFIGDINFGGGGAGGAATGTATTWNMTAPTGVSPGVGFAKMGVTGTLPMSKTISPEAAIASNATTINIVNNTQSEVTTQESSGPNGEKVIEFLITNKVKEGLASGLYDKQMQMAYGIRRKGV